MRDKEIIALFWERDQRAISETSERYGSYCTSIARNILANSEDAEECVNETWLAAWNAIPPHKPAVLSAFLGKLTRNIAINYWRLRRAEKRGGGEMDAVLDELSECVSGAESAEEALERKELLRAIHTFLRKLPAQKRRIFLCRYWYSDSIAEISAGFGIKENTAVKTLSRTRNALRSYLAEKGFEL